MALVKSEGMVVRRRDLGEADRIVTLFTRRFGKIRAVAKGCRRPGSRLAGHLEPLNLAHFLLWKRDGRDLALVRSAELIEPCAAVTTDFRAFAAAQAAAELIDASLPEDEPQPRLFVLMQRFLRALKTPEHAVPALLAFSVRAAQTLGYALTVDGCAACGTGLPAGEGRLEFRSGGLVCAPCADTSGAAGEDLTAASVRALRAAAADPPRATRSEDAAPAVRAVHRLLCWHQDRRLPSSERLLAESAAVAPA